MKRELLLAFQIKSINNQIKRLFEKTAIIENKANLTGMQYAILGFLAEHEGRDIYQKDIEAEFNIRRSTASSMVASLEREGFIRREGVPGDGRLKKIIPDERAREIDKIAKKNMEGLQRRMTSGISEAELEQFNQTLLKIRANLEEQAVTNKERL